MIKNRKKTLLKVFMAILTVCILWHTGNPLNWLAARIKIAEHLEQNYGEGYTFDCSYMWFGRTKGYSGKANKTESKDDNFHVYYIDGEVSDNRKIYVTSGFNTQYRINNEYKKIVKPVLEKVNGLLIHDANFFNMPEEMLIIDKEYDILSIAAEYGTLVLSFEKTDGTIAEYAAKLLEIKDVCDKNKIPFKYIDLDAVDESGSLSDFSYDGIPYNEIYPENLENRLYLKEF